MLPPLEMMPHIMFHDFSIDIWQRCLRALKPISLERLILFSTLVISTSDLHLTSSLDAWS